MRKAFTIKVPNPCSKSWEGMEPKEEGRFCNTCQKTVYDFTQFTDQEFIAFFQQNATACGRFKKRQLSILISAKRKAFFPFGKFPPLAAATLIAAGLSISAPAQSVRAEAATQIVVGDTLLQKKPADVPLLLKGRVVDESGEAIIGATVLLKGTTTGTLTDADGNFQLEVAELRKYRVVIKSIGVEDKEIAMKPASPVVVEMENDTTSLGGAIYIEYTN